MSSFLFFTTGYPIISFVANQARRYFEYGSGYQSHNRETFTKRSGQNTKYFKWLHIKDGFDIIQYQVKRLCIKPEPNTDLFPLFLSSRL